MSIESMKQELQNMDAALWRARAAAVRTSHDHIQIGHAIDSFGRLKKAIEATVAMAQVYRCKIKSRKQIDREIPREKQGWWADVAAGQLIRLREATQADLDRSVLNEAHSKNPVHYMCETHTGGSLVSKMALEYMNPEQNVFAAIGDTHPQPKQEPVPKMTAHRAAYFMDRFKREEKLLGPNEQAAVDFVTAMLNTHPQPKREPLTYKQIRDLWASENGLEDCDMCQIDDFIAAVRFVEAAHGITGGGAV